MNAYTLSQSIPRIQQVFRQYEKELEKKQGWTVEGFVDADPTENKIYLAWIVNSFILGGILRFEDVVSRVPPALHDFIYLQDKISPGEPGKPWTNERDINNYCGLIGCKKKKFQQMGLEELMDRYHTLLESRRDKIEMSQRIHDETEILLDNNEVTVYIPKTKDASCYYGQGTKWCTAATRAENSFEEYNNEGSLYIIIGKDGKKFQMHPYFFQLMDAEDSDYSIVDLVIRYPTLKTLQPVKYFLFLTAVQQGNEIYVRRTIKDIDPTINENFAIKEASELGYTNIVRVLLADGRVDPTDDDNFSLRVASEGGHSDIVKLLLRDPRVSSKPIDGVILQNFIMFHNPDMVKLLLQYVDPSDNYAIQLAVREQDPEILQILLDDPRVDPSGVLNMAKQIDNKEILQILDSRINPSLKS